MLQGKKYIPIIPPNMAKIRKLGDLDIPQPSVEHTLVKCDICDGDGWIGPGQLTELTFQGGTKICYWCLIRDMRDNPVDLDFRTADRTADDKPRRT